MEPRAMMKTGGVQFKFQRCLGLLSDHRAFGRFLPVLISATSDLPGLGVSDGVLTQAMERIPGLNLGR